VLSAYRTLVRAAFARGDERRALTLLSSLESVGQRRGLPRLRLHSLAEQVRLHAVQGRREAVARLLRKRLVVVARLAGPVEEARCDRRREVPPGAHPIASR
jgi:LuxR family maltose regulon positive regulatory protein